MGIEQETESRHSVLWRIGAAFTRSGADDYDEVIDTAIEMFAVALGARAASIWNVCLPGLVAEVNQSWASAAGPDFSSHADINLDSAVADELLAAGGAVIMSDTTLAGEARAAELGLDGHQSGVAIISQTETHAIVIVVGATFGNWGAHEVDMLRGFATLIGGFNQRVREERSLQLRLRLDALIVTGSSRLLAADSSDCEKVVHVVLTELGDVLSARIVALLHMAHGHSEVETVVIHSTDPNRGSLLDLSAINFETLAQIDGNGLREVLENQQEFDLRLVLPSMSTVPAETSAAIDDVQPSVLLMPMSAKGGRTTALLLARDSNEAWLPEEIDATKTLASLIAQATIRATAEEQSHSRLEALEVVSAAIASLIDVGPDDFDDTVAGVLRSVGMFLGADSVTTWQVRESDNTYFVRSSWVADSAQPDLLRSSISWGEHPIFDRARVGSLTGFHSSEDSLGGGTASVVVPTGGSQVDGLLVALRSSSHPWGTDSAPVLEPLSRAIRQAGVRVASQNYSIAAFASAPVGMALVDSDKRFASANKAFVEFIGCESSDELVGQSPDDVIIGNVGNLEWTAFDGLEETEIPFRRFDGTQVWGRVRVTRIAGIIHGEWMWLCHIEDITARRQATNLLRYQAAHDDLTGLLNRRSLTQMLEEHTESPDGGPIAILLLDLDRFKVINDSLGHERGDELLVVVSDRLRLSVRPDDHVARLGGDEFAIMVRGDVDVDSVRRLSDRIMGILGRPVTLGHQDVYPSASIGIVVGDASTDPSELMRRADIAMYRAKAEGRGRYAIFDDELRIQANERMATEAGLRSALRNNELLVHYQPEISLEDGSIVAVEALVRWQHPDLGLLPAAYFIDVAEEAGLLVEIGDSVLREACREASSWSRTGGAPIVSVNLAAAQIQRKETVELVRAALLDAGMAASQLCLEITETALMRDPIRSEKILAKLKDLGVMLAVDDFGTGYSSLAYLKRFPVDILKIDRSFVKDLGADLDDEKFVSTIIRLADSLGLRVVAEGVETEHQAEILYALGCSTAQGYHFARPASASDLGAWL